jgi:hypothetical protein
MWISDAMSVYRFYPIKKNGHVAGPPIVCDFARDNEALAEAKKHLNDHDIEVWQDARIVAYLVPDQD